MLDYKQRAKIATCLENEIKTMEGVAARCSEHELPAMDAISKESVGVYKDLLQYLITH
jgi:hypothetical protein